MASFSSACRSLVRKLSRVPCSAQAQRSLLSTGISKEAVGYHVGGGPSYMRGTVFWEPGKPLTIEELHMPIPKVGEVLIRTKGSNCSFSHPSLPSPLEGHSQNAFASVKFHPPVTHTNAWITII